MEFRCPSSRMSWAFIGARTEASSSVARRYRIFICCAASLIGMVKAFAETCTFLNVVAQCAVERNDRGISSTNLQIDLWAPQLGQTLLCGLHERPGDASTAIGALNREMVNPAPHAVKARDDCGNNSTIYEPDKK